MTYSIINTDTHVQKRLQACGIYELVETGETTEADTEVLVNNNEN